MKKLESKSKESLKELYNKLSKGTYHVNELLFPRDLIYWQGSKSIKPHEPTYDK